ncbi:MAG TPA: GAF domain-containing sensor histidine kinase, partial [Bacteroidales bacterium]|nr:GAF domain-containing sensor histidine kinase [Bacteroidales bacterium]
METHNELLESLQRISHYTFSTNKKFFDFLLKEAIALSQSKIGYIFMYNEQTKIFTLSAWSKEVMPNCAIPNPQIQYKLDDTGLWGETVRQRKPIIENNYCAKKSPLSKGTPDKHVVLKTYATVPVFVDNKIVAVIGVANKSQNYTETEVTQLQVLTDRAWKILEKQELFASLVIAKEKAEESNALKTKFLSNISHEIRTPMNAILGFSDMLDIENITAEERTHYVSIVKQSGQQLMKVINDIIEISKIQTQTIVPEKQVCTIFSIVKNAIEIVQQQQYLKLKTHISIEISDSIKQADISIISDQVYLQKIFTNLISNAIKYTKDGWVKIGAYEPRNGFITFYVQDTGIGIPQEKHEEIFGFFNQLQNKTIVEGIGIGLSIIKGLVNVLGGSVWLDSEVNVGT